MDKDSVLLFNIIRLITTYSAKLNESPCKTVKFEYGS